MRKSLLRLLLIVGVFVCALDTVKCLKYSPSNGRELGVVPSIHSRQHQAIHGRINWRSVNDFSESVAATQSVKREAPSYLDIRGGDAPTLSRWIGPALVSALSYAMYNIFIKLGSSSIHPILGGVILQFVAALVGSVLLAVVVSASPKSQVLFFDQKGIGWSICAGMAVGAAEILSFQVSGMGVPASQSMPLMIGGSVVFGSVLGFLLLQERMTARGWFGVLCIVMGVACVATDPGAKLSAH